MSRMSDMLNRNKKTTAKATELDSALGRLRSVIEDGIADLANGLADEIEKTPKDEDYDCRPEINGYKKFFDSAKQAGWRCESEGKEMVQHPDHYKGKKFEVIDIIEDYGLGFNLGNAIKYILRAGHKDDYVQDLKKAIWYLDREISKQEEHNKSFVICDKV